MDRTAVVTGAARGIGAAITEKLLSLGFRVCATDRDEQALEDCSKRLLLTHGPGNLFVQTMDVEKTADIESVAQAVQNKWGAVHVLVNNAGVFGEAPFLTLEEGNFEKILSVNLLGTFRVSQIFGRMMAKQNEGKIINIASISALKGAPRAAHYAASKAGIVGLTKSMAVELADYNIQVNVILPGYIETEMMGQKKESMRKLASWRVPVKRLGTPQEVSETVGFLASVESSYLTGSEIVLDGGLTLG